MYSERRPVREIVVSELSRRPLVAYQKGCGPNSTAAHMGRETFTLGGTMAEVATRPVGWLPDDRLVVLAYDEGCAGVSDLCSPEGAELLVEGVQRAAVRAKLPPPPDPPRVATEVVA